MNKEQQKDIIQIDFQKFIQKIRSFWWMFLLSLIATFCIGQLYLRYTTFEYSSRAVLLIKDAGKSGNLSEKNILSSGAAGLASSGKSMDNEIQILKSLTLMEKVVEKLRLNVAYFRLGNVKETELYNESPFLLDSFSLKQDNSYGLNYYLDLKDYQSFILKKDEDDDGVKCFFGIPFETEEGFFTISLSPIEPIIQGIHKLSIAPVESTASKYKSRLSVERIGSQFLSSTLSLNILDPVAQKSADLLNILIEVYNEEEVNDENQVFRNTMKFIDARVANLVLELDTVEGGIQRFKSSNKIFDTNAASSLGYTIKELRSAVQELSIFEIKKKLLLSLEAFVTKDATNHVLIPNHLIAESPVLSNLVMQYNGLVIQHDRLVKTASIQNPAAIEMREQLENIRTLILQTIQNLRKNLQIPMVEIEGNIRELEGSVGSIPGIEKRLLEKMRTQTVKENLFLFLLQKREDTALSEAITTAKTRTIERARVSRSPVYPKPKLILVFSVVLGVFVPLIGLIIITLFENKIDSEDTIKRLTNIPILGHIGFNKKGDHILVKQGSRTAINEMFRLLRTKLNFINHNKQQQTILFTSSTSGEGKTFIALNLGITLALSNKKVIIIGLDLRKPKLGLYLNSTNPKGVSNYLIQQSSLDEIIQHFPDNPNLAFITSGPAPPNPGELLLTEQMFQLIESLKERYDYILIDTPPIGLVSDALILGKYVDTSLLVIRHKTTYKNMVRNLEDMYSKNELQRPHIIYNGVKEAKNYYGYGHNQDYYVEED